MSVGMAECSYSGEVFDDALALPADERFVDAEDVRIPVDVDDWLAECERFLFERGDEGVISRFSPADRRFFSDCPQPIPLPHVCRPRVLQITIPLRHEHYRSSPI